MRRGCFICCGGGISRIRHGGAGESVQDLKPGVSGYRAEVLAEVRVQEEKFARLAEAISAGNYTWRPVADVRSIAEVFLHVAAANHNLPKLIGTPLPAGIDVESLEKSPRTKPRWSAR